MAMPAAKASKITTLVLGKVQVPVALFPATGKPSKLADFDTAGPSGGVLKAQTLARPTPALEQQSEEPQPVRSDPLADDPGPVDAPPAWEGAAAPAASVQGQYGRELVEEGTGEVVPPDKVRRGVRLEDGRFIDCTEQLEAISERTLIENMRVIGFVDITRVSRAHVIGAYYLGSNDPAAAKPLRLIFEGLRTKRRGAVVKFTKNRRQTCGVIGWFAGALMFYELVWAEDFRPPPDRASMIQQAQISESEVVQVCKLIDAMAIGVDDLYSLRDDAIALREELRVRAEAGEIATVVEPVEQPGESTELADALEASLAMIGVA